MWGYYYYYYYCCCCCYSLALRKREIENSECKCKVIVMIKSQWEELGVGGSLCMYVCIYVNVDYGVQEAE